MELDNYYMSLALQEAQKAYEKGEVPVGAIIVSEQRVIGRGHNQTVSLNDPSAHAEMIALTSACTYLQSRYLTNCALYVTLEPCPMCAGALYWAMCSSVVYGAHEAKRGFSLFYPRLLHPKSTVKSGVMEKECQEILLRFFRERRD